MRNMDGGGRGPTRDEVLGALVRDLALDQNAALYKPGSDDLMVALLEEHSRDVVLWAQIKPFSIAYAKRFPQPDVTDADVEDALQEAVNESIYFLTNAILKRRLRGEPPYNLGSLAEVTFAKNTRKWERWKDHLTNKSFDGMSRCLRLWEVTTIERAPSRGGTIAGYKIEAGQALLDFHAYVYHPLRVEMLRKFCENYLSK